MKFFTIFIAVFCLFASSASSCQNRNSSQKDFKISSAEESTWFGGVRGVSGKTIRIVAEKLGSQKINFLKLVYNNIEYPVRVSETSKNYTITSTFSNLKKADYANQISQNSNTLSADHQYSLKYTIGTSKKLYFKKITNITEKTATTEEVPN